MTLKSTIFIGESMEKDEKKLESGELLPEQEAEKLATSWLVYVERESPFGLPVILKKTAKEQVVRLGELQRAIGVVEGTITEFDEKTLAGTIEIDGYAFPFQDARPAERRQTNLTTLLAKTVRYSFWPTFDEPPKSSRKKLPLLKIVGIRKQAEPPSGYIEVVGRLEKIWSGKFLVSFWSQRAQKFFYVIFNGEYPYPDEIGKFVWLMGKFEPKSATVSLEDANVIAFVPKDQVLKILQSRQQLKPPSPRHQNSSMYKKNAAGPKYGKLNRFQPRSNVTMVKIEQIEIPPNQKNTPFNTQRLEYLKNIYKVKKAPPEPIIVKKIQEGKYVLVDGLRRLRVAIELGYQTIPAYIVGME